MEKVLIVGAAGLLGSEVMEQFQDNFHVIAGLHKSSNTIPSTPSVIVDISSEANIFEVIKDLKPNFIINCAGLTSIEECEKFPEKSFLLNAVGPYYLSKISKKFDCKFVHISTDHFQSTDLIPRSELVEMIPINHYGFGKYHGECYVKNINSSALIIRTNFFGFNSRRESFFSKMIHSLNNSNFYNGFNDIKFSPIGITTLVSAIKVALESNLVGLLNIGSTEEITKLDFVNYLSRELGNLNIQINSIRSDTIEGRIVRPKYLSLDSRNFIDQTHFMMPNISTMIRQELKKFHERFQ